MRTLRISLLTSALLVLGASAFAEDAAVSPAVAESTATPAAPATPPLSPENSKRETGAVADAKDEITYRLSRARRRIAGGKVASGQVAEIQRALDRGESQIQTQVARLDAANAAPDAGSLDHVARVQEEIVALSKIAHAAAGQVEAVRTHDDDTEETLQAASEEIEKISERSDEIAERMEDMRSEMEDRAGEIADAHGVGILRGKHGTHVGVNTEDERVEFGGSVDVKKDEKVESAVAFGGTVTVAGDVMGDAVAFGGNVHVTETGHVHGAAASFGGRVIVDDGGHVDGEKTQVGAGKLALGLLPGTASPAEPPARPHSWPESLGFRLLHAGIEFLCFFVLGMLVLLIVPKQTMVVAEAIEHHPVKSGGIGLLVLFAAVPLTLLLIVTLVGIPLALLLWPALFVSGFFGYVALALVIGRRLPSGIIPTSNALLALGAVVIVAVGMIPFLGSLVWCVLGMLALGGVALTRFGTDKGGINAPPSPPGDILEAVA